MSDHRSLDERIREARIALHKLHMYWLERTNNALADLRKQVEELERERLQRYLNDKEEAP